MGPAQGTFEMRGARLTDSVTLGQYSLPRAAIVFRDRGIRENDRVLSFDGTAAELMNPAVFRAALQHGEPVKVVVDRDGMKLEFTVGSYALP
jgi:hypothetical protein